MTIGGTPIAGHHHLSIHVFKFDLRCNNDHLNIQYLIKCLYKITDKTSSENGPGPAMCSWFGSGGGHYPGTKLRMRLDPLKISSSTRQ